MAKMSLSGSGVANAKPKYPPDASGGYNYKSFSVSNII